MIPSRPAFLLASVPALLSASPLVTGCGGPPKPGHFAGRSEPARTPADEVIEVSSRPPGYEVLGRVSASCEDVRRVESLDEVWLVDVACSEALLAAVLRAKVASVGGDLLIARRCSSDEDDEGREIACNGRVGRRGEGAPWPAQAGDWQTGARPVDDEGAEDAPWLAHPRQSYRVAVTATAARQGGFARARPPSEVREAPRQPAAQRRLASIIARCEGRCELSVVREAVRAGGARIGADSVYDVRCVQGPEGRLCTGDAGAFEADPRQVAEAR